MRLPLLILLLMASLAISAQTVSQLKLNHGITVTAVIEDFVAEEHEIDTAYFDFPYCFVVDGQRWHGWPTQKPIYFVDARS